MPHTRVPASALVRPPAPHARCRGRYLWDDARFCVWQVCLSDLAPASWFSMPSDLEEENPDAMPTSDTGFEPTAAQVHEWIISALSVNEVRSRDRFWSKVPGVTQSVE